MFDFCFVLENIFLYVLNRQRRKVFFSFYENVSIFDIRFKANMESKSDAA